MCEKTIRSVLRLNAKRIFGKNIHIFKSNQYIISTGKSHEHREERLSCDIFQYIGYYLSDFILRYPTNPIHRKDFYSALHQQSRHLRWFRTGVKLHFCITFDHRMWITAALKAIRYHSLSEIKPNKHVIFISWTYNTNEHSHKWLSFAT